jgi:hypothetical protein
MLKCFIHVIEADWGGAVTADVAAVVRSAADCFKGALSEKNVEPIRVEPTPTIKEPPITLFERADTGEVRILLSARGTHWSQFAYQFAHELCHVEANFCEPIHHRSKWIEECICEASSLFAIRRMAEAWKTAPPYETWRSYATSLENYFEEHYSQAVHQLPVEASFPEWLVSHLDLLRADDGRRADNTIIAQQLLPIFERDADAWRAVRYLNLWNAGEDSSVEEYCRHWRAASPLRLRAFVDSIEHCLTGQ